MRSSPSSPGTATIVTYHYVRPLKGSRYPGIKGLELDDFRGQLAYFKRHYRFVSLEDCAAAARGEKRLPANALLLTFDDGFIDHYLHVFPILDQEGIPGAFYPPAEAVENRKALDVHKIHHILACAIDQDALIRRLLSLLEEHRERFALPEPRALFEKLAVPFGFDAKEVIFFKRALQRELPPEARAFMIGRLFTEFVARDEAEFAGELYMSAGQLRVMARHGMAVGSHGFSHRWLNSLTPEDQEAEIDRSLEFLKSLGAADGWSIAYPYGAYDETTLEILRRRGCALGLSTGVGLARLCLENSMTLERLDTNEFPRLREAEPNAWTAQALR